MLVDYQMDESVLKEIEIIPSERALAASNAFWIPSPSTTEAGSEGVLAIMDKGNGIINLRAIGFRKFSEDTGSQWLVETQIEGSVPNFSNACVGCSVF